MSRTICQGHFTRAGRQWAEGEVGAGTPGLTLPTMIDEK